MATLNYGYLWRDGVILLWQPLLYLKNNFLKNIVLSIFLILMIFSENPDFFRQMFQPKLCSKAEFDILDRNTIRTTAIIPLPF